MTLNISVSETYYDNNTCDKSKKLKWVKATEQNILSYKSLLDEGLSQISVPWKAIQCKNVLCDCEKHKHDVLKF